MFSKSLSWVQNYISLTTLPKEIQAMMNPNLAKDEQLNITIAIVISKIKNKEGQLALAQQAVQEGLSLRAVKARISGAEAAIGGGAAPTVKPSDAYGALLGLVASVNRRLGDYVALAGNLDEMMALLLRKRIEKKLDATAIVAFCDKSIAILTSIRNAARKWSN
jgi:hypothetical protein